MLTEGVSEMVPPPFAAVATCMKLLNDAPVLATPLLVIVELNVAAFSAFAVVGVTDPAERSGRYCNVVNGTSPPYPVPALLVA